MSEKRPDNWGDFINALIVLEDRAHRLGLHKTAHALNRAKQDAGYEMGAKIEKAMKAGATP